MGGDRKAVCHYRYVQCLQFPAVLLTTIVHGSSLAFLFTSQHHYAMPMYMLSIHVVLMSVHTWLVVG